MKTKVNDCEEFKARHAEAQMSPDLRQHLKDCRPCREEVEIASVLRQARDQTLPPKTLQNPAQLWWRAQILRDLVRHEEQTNLTLRPIYWTWAAVLTFIFFTLALFLGQRIAFLGGTILPQMPTTEWLPWALGLLAFFGALPLVTAVPTLWLLWREG